MIFLAAFLAALLAVQEPRKPSGTEEELIPGLPEGEAPPLPQRIKWDLAEAVRGQTRTRQRITLEGLWRFAAVPEREAPVQRAEMGWIQMPGHWTRDRVRVFDSQFRVADGVWRGRPLEQHPWAWAERDIDTPSKWLDYRIFLVVSGPWAEAEVYVQAEPIKGTDRDGVRWFEITESLVYPGSVPLSMRLRSAGTGESDEDPEAEEQPPHIGLELLPVGPRVERIELRRDERRRGLAATFHLTRPVGFPIAPGPPIRTIPMSLLLRLDDGESESTVRKMDVEVGNMPEHTKTVNVFIPWSARPDDPPLESARLRTRFAPTAGGLWDEPFPVVFKARELEPVE